MQDTIFEKIITREIPSEVVYEDDTVFAFLDIKPINVGHTLVVPKKKFVNIFDADPSVLGQMLIVAQKIAVALKALTRCDGININMNNGPAAGQEVFHAHIHVIPRFDGDEVYRPAKHQEYDKEVAQKLAHALFATLN